MGTVRKVGASERVVGDPTAGITREEAIATDGMWAGLARTAAGIVSGWHHHGENDTTVYVAAGIFRVEFGPGGSEVVEAHPDDFVLIPRGAIHRESNPSDEESRLVVVRSGTGLPTINVDGPDGP